MVAVVAGSNQSRILPEFFEAAFPLPVRQIASPGFSLRKSRAISLPRSIAHILGELPAFRRSLATLAETIRSTQPDLIVNFLEPLMGVYNLLRPHAIPVLAVGHQFMLEHPAFVKVNRFPLQRFGMKQFVRLAGARSAQMALSFYPAPDLAARRCFVSPPILRQQLFELRSGDDGGFLLVYLLNHGYADDIANWSREHPRVPVHCFYDKPGAPGEERHGASLTFHRINGEKFLRLMARCRGVACTAGFESVSEAAYLGKPLLMVPVQHHLEQFLNSCDAEQSGLGLRDDAFRLSRLLEPTDRRATFQFRNWVDQAETIAMSIVERTAASGSRATRPLRGTARESAGEDGLRRRADNAGA